MNEALNADLVLLKVVAVASLDVAHRVRDQHRDVEHRPRAPEVDSRAGGGATLVQDADHGLRSGEVARAQQDDDAVAATLEHGHLAELRNVVHASVRAGVRREDHPVVEHYAYAVGHAARLHATDASPFARAGGCTRSCAAEGVASEPSPGEPPRRPRRFESVTSARSVESPSKVGAQTQSRSPACRRLPDVRRDSDGRTRGSLRRDLRVSAMVASDSFESTFQVGIEGRRVSKRGVESRFHGGSRGFAGADGGNCRQVSKEARCGDEQENRHFYTIPMPRCRQYGGAHIRQSISDIHSRHAAWVEAG
jgi:hypothetical protein